MKRLSSLTAHLKLCITIICAYVFLNIGQVQAAAFGQLIPFWDDREDSSSVTVDHAQWQKILDKYVDNQTIDGINRFDYSGVLAEDKSQLDSYLQSLQNIDPRRLAAQEQKAYWINLYNAATVNIVIEQGTELSSIRQIKSGIFKPGPWKLKIVTVAQQALSLDDIEHGILRPIWRGNRIHYAVNCASLGCPNLLKTAFTSANIEALLEQAAHDFINHPRAVSIEGDELKLSSIFDWYAQDFGDDFSELIVHLLQFTDPELSANLQAYSDADYDYDWSLNRQ